MALTWTKLPSNIWRAVAGNGDDVITLASEGGVLTNQNNLLLNGGNDTAYLDFGNDGVWGGTGRDTIFGGWGNDFIWGEDDNDVLHGDGGNDKLVGGGGADAMYGGAGDDILDNGYADYEWDNLSGGDGHDTYVIWDSRDVITGEAAYGTATSRDHIQLQATAYNMNASADTRAIENLTILSTQGATVTGNMLANMIAGNKGNDSVHGDAGNDTIAGGEGHDNLNGGLGDDTLMGDRGNDTLAGSNGTDKIYGGHGADSLYGGYQSDFMDGGIGGDWMSGGDGHDTMYGDKDLANPGEAGADTIYGGAGNDTIYGGGQSDFLYGGDGNDRLYGDAGNDQHYGGKGDDLYVFDSAGDRAYEKSGEGYDIIQTRMTNATIEENVEAMQYVGAAAAVTFEGSDNAETLSIHGASSGTIYGRNGHDNLTGSVGDDALYGGAGNDFIQGLSGNDRIYGEAGFDEMRGGLGNDVYYYATSQDKIVEGVNGGYDTVYVDGDTFVMSENVEAATLSSFLTRILIGNSGDNVMKGNAWGTLISGGAGNDTINGMDGDDRLEGGAGNDTLAGGNHNDILNGGTGDDLMQGGAGNDTYFVDSAGDRVVESIFGNGIDTVKSTFSAYTLAADVENLIFTGKGNFTGTGSDRDNRIEGGAGDDTLRGMGGNDVIVGKGGADKIWGGSGADSFVFQSPGTKAHVYDFAAGVDKLVLKANAGWNFSYVDADTTRFANAAGDTITVDGLGIGNVWNSLELV